MNTTRINAGAVLAGLLFMLIGAVLGADAYMSWDIPTALLWPAMLIAGGVLLILPRRGL